MAFDFDPYRVGGALRPDSISGFQPSFGDGLAAMFAAAPPAIQQNLRILSGYRSPERQAELWQNALAKYGSAEAARKWVAPPGRSQHNHGNAADLKFLNNEARQWVHQNASNYGLGFPLSNENWHVELLGARKGAPTPTGATIGTPANDPSRMSLMPSAAAANPAPGPAQNPGAAPPPPVPQPNQNPMIQALLNMAPSSAPAAPPPPRPAPPPPGMESPPPLLSDGPPVSQQIQPISAEMTATSPAPLAFNGPSLLSAPPATPMDPRAMMRRPRMPKTAPLV
jgi:hypothetical protein